MKNLFISSAVIVSLFLIALLFYSVKIGNDDFCGSDSITNIPPSSVVFYGTVLDSPNSFAYQNMVLDQESINYYENYNFCFDGVINSSSYLSLDVVLNGEVLGTFNVDNNSESSCFDITSKEFSPNNNLIGLNCVNCDSSNSLTLGNSLSDFELTSFKSGLSQSESINYRLVGVKNCKGFFKSLLYWMIIFILLIAVIYLINIFVKGVSEVSFDDW